MKSLAQVNIGEHFWVKEGEGIINRFPNLGSMGSFFSILLGNIYVIAGIILFFLLIGGGLMVIVSAGSDNPEGAARGKKAITAAIVGFLIIFTSYWIIQIIEAITGLEILNPRP